MAKKQPARKTSTVAKKAAAAKKVPAKKSPAKKATAKKSVASKPAAKAAPAKKAAVGKAAKKAPAKKATAKTPPAAQSSAANEAPVAKPAPASSRKAVPKRASRGPATDELGAHEVLARLSMFARAQDDVGEELTLLVARLEQIAEPALVPALFGVLDDDDPHGVLWSVFYLLESFDDAYFDGLLTVLPDLYERAPGWAETAILRIANTRGEPEDCIDAVVTLAKQRKAPARRKLVALVDRIAADTEGLHPSQRRSVEQLARAIEA